MGGVDEEGGAVKQQWLVASGRRATAVKLQAEGALLPLREIEGKLSTDAHG